jgi:hypothetical protein
MPFFFNIGLYLNEKETMQWIQKNNKFLKIIFWANNILIVSTCLLAITFETFKKYT